MFNKKAEKYYQRASIEVDNINGNSHGGLSDTSAMNKNSIGGRRLSRRQYIVVMAYITFRVFYSILFTFTVVLALLGLALQSDVMQVCCVMQCKLYFNPKYTEQRPIKAVYFAIKCKLYNTSVSAYQILSR